PVIPGYRSRLATFLVHGSANQLMRARRFADAEAACREAMVIQERLVNEFPEVAGYRAELAYTLRGSARLLVFDGLPGEEGRKLADPSVTHTWALLRDDPNMPWFRRYYSTCLASRGAVAANSGDRKLVVELVDRLKSGVSEPILDFTTPPVWPRVTRNSSRTTPNCRKPSGSKWPALTATRPWTCYARP